MRNKTFIISCVSALLICCAVYYIVIDGIAIPNRTVDSSYKQFLLKASSRSINGRIIISSGSNSQYSIDAGMMEDHFGRLVINLADNGDYPLEHKIYNLSNYANNGDILIFPLEWVHFKRIDGLTAFYVRSIFNEKDDYSFYYRELPFFEKLLFIFKHVPLSLSLSKMFKLNNFSWDDNVKQNDINAMKSIYHNIEQRYRGSVLDDIQARHVDKGSDTLSCDEYIGLTKNFFVSTRFKKDLKLLQTLVKKNNTRVFFTWPAVVGKTGNECYTSEVTKNNLDTFTSKIVDEVSAHGFRFIGNVYDSRFDSSCFRGTYYHIMHHCAIDRTTRLIELLEKEGITKRDGYSSDAIKVILDDFAARIEMSLLANYKAIHLNVPIENADLTKYLYFGKGWSRQEEQGIWSIGKSSTIIVPKPEKPFDFVKFNGQYFNGDEKTGVWINGTFFGDFILTDQTIGINTSILYGEYIKITLEHKNPISAADLGADTDTRKVKYGLQSIELITSEGI